MRKSIMMCLVAVLSCTGSGSETLGETLGESGISTRFEDGVPDPGSTWVKDQTTGWGWLQGGVNFEVHNLIGDTTAYSLVRDNANSCMYCADGDSVIMMYVVYPDTDPTRGVVIDEDPSVGDGTSQLLHVQEFPHAEGRVFIRLYTYFVFTPSSPSLSLVQPPHS